VVGAVVLVAVVAALQVNNSHRTSNRFDPGTVGRKYGIAFTIRRGVPALGRERFRAQEPSDGNFATAFFSVCSSRCV
jgi:hypothetical protein